MARYFSRKKPTATATPRQEIDDSEMQTLRDGLIDRSDGDTVEETLYALRNRMRQSGDNSFQARLASSGVVSDIVHLLDEPLSELEVPPGDVFSCIASLIFSGHHLQSVEVAQALIDTSTGIENMTMGLRHPDDKVRIQVLRGCINACNRFVTKPDQFFDQDFIEAIIENLDNPSASIAGRAGTMCSALASSPLRAALMPALGSLVRIMTSEGVELRYWDSALAVAKLVGDQEDHPALAGAQSAKLMKVLVTNTQCALDGKSVPGANSIPNVPTYAPGLANLAVSDKNKIELGKAGAIGLLQAAVLSKKAQDPTTQAELLRALWHLSFIPDHHNQIVNNKLFMDRVREVAQAKTSEITVEMKKNAAGIIWEVEEKNLVEESDKSDKQEQESGHVMISYNWGSQEVALKVRDWLEQHGVKVWLDVAEMKGSTLEAMADAVERAYVVLVCLSELYKKSTACRAEAEYAFAKKKNIIPLMMQSGYAPDGWLGILVGSKLYYELTDSSLFDQNMNSLYKALPDSGQKPSVAPTTTTSQKQQPELVGATTDKVCDLLEGMSVDGSLIEVIKAKNIDGTSVIALRRFGAKAAVDFLIDRLGVEPIQALHVVVALDSL